MRRLFSLLFCLLLLAVPARAHPGGTDSKGGHTDHSTGEYHYHHGEPAHQHVNGFCPYATCTPTPRIFLYATPKPTPIYTLKTLPPSSYTTPAPQKESGSGTGRAALAGAGGTAALFIGYSLIKRIWRS